MLDVLGNEPPELIGGQSLTEKEPLSLIASHGHKQGQLLLCLDALGDDCHTQMVANIRDAGGDCASTLAAIQVSDKRAVDLEPIDGEFSEGAQ